MKQHDQPSRPSGWLRTGLVLGAAFAVPAAINTILAMRQRVLAPAFGAEGGVYAWPLGSIAYEARGTGEPLVLVHGVGAGESAFEWRRVFDRLAESHRVYALDLPGFGRSARRAQAYTADLYISALHDFLRDVVGKPAAVLASSLPGAWAVQLAHARPEMISRLALVCPTGLETLRSPIPVVSPLLYGLFSLPVWSTSLYNAIASRASIERYLRDNIYADPSLVTDALTERYYVSAHQPNAQFVLRSFVSGLLDCDLTTVWPTLKQPTLVIWGRHARVTPVENATAFIRGNPTARLRVFENSGMLPHDEEAEDFVGAVQHFLAQFGQREGVVKNTP